MRYLVLDLETVPVSNAAEFVTTDDISAPSNYGAEAAAKYCAKERDKRIEQTALDMDLARICAVGYQRDSDVAPRVFTLKTEDEEAAQLEQLRAILADDAPAIVTFNGRAFDLPLLMRRARYLGVAFPRLNLDRYKSFHVDLYEELTMRGTIKSHSLRWYFRRHGWTDLLDSDPLKQGGAEVGIACAEGRWDDIAAHLSADVCGTLRLAQWLGVVPSGVPETAGAF